MVKVVCVIVEILVDQLLHYKAILSDEMGDFPSYHRGAINDTGNMEMSYSLGILNTHKYSEVW